MEHLRTRFLRQWGQTESWFGATYQGPGERCRRVTGVWKEGCAGSICVIRIPLWLHCKGWAGRDATAGGAREELIQTQHHPTLRLRGGWMLTQVHTTKGPNWSHTQISEPPVQSPQCHPKACFSTYSDDGTQTQISRHFLFLDPTQWARLCSSAKIQCLQSLVPSLYLMGTRWLCLEVSENQFPSHRTPALLCP